MGVYIFAALVILFVLSLFDNWKRKHDNRPPGPYKLPILGNLPYMLPAVLDLGKVKAYLKLDLEFVDKFFTYKPAYMVMDSLSQTYGSLTSLQFGVNSAVIVGNSEYARQVFSREEFADRFADGWFLERQFQKPLGLIFNNGKPYRALKMFAMKHLKDFGLGRKENMEIAVEEELLDFLREFQQQASDHKNHVPIHHIFTLPVLNILWDMVAGIRFPYNDSKSHRMIAITEQISRSHDLGGNILMAFPWLRHVAPNLTGHNRQMQLYDELKGFFWSLLHERMESYDGSTPRDFVDVFVAELKRQKASGDSCSPLLTEEQFVIVCMDLFTAGSETTANTLEFALLYMCLNPHVQKRVQQEIDEVIGQCRLPSVHDRYRMPYTCATLLETQRVCNVIPLVHRVTTRDTRLGPYRINKGDVAVVNLHTIHMDPKVWNNPTEFKPERFLDENGNLHVPESFLPFGMGKRVCMGENLAKYTLFNYFTSLLQRYTFQVPSENETPKLKPGRGFTIAPDKFTALVTPRFS